MKKIIFSILLSISPIVHAEILFQDPTGESFNEAYRKYSPQELKNLGGPEKSVKSYLLGLLYLDGDSEFDVPKDCNKALNLLENSWSHNITDAGYSLAIMYYKGDCVSKDIEKSGQLAKKTAQDGFILSQRMLGRAYWGREWNELFPKNMKKAIYWLSKAGEAGDNQSAGNLAYIYREGYGVKKDEEKSFFWVKQAAFSEFSRKDFGVSFSLFGKYFEQGIGTDVDLIKAYKYYDLNGTAGIKDKQRIAKKMTQEQIDEAIQQSKEWQKEHNIKVGSGLIRRVD